jgi:class 3 adenylate cyclase/alpha-beta hydrolase superfamily lysophospholipase
VIAPPPIQFAVRDGKHLAFQSAGGGPDLVFVAGALAISLSWEQTAPARGLRRLASFSRLVTYDQQGMGYSDRMDLSSPPTLEDLVLDLEAVIEAAGVNDPILFGTHNGGAVAALYATRHPVRQLILCNTWAKLERSDDFPIGLPTWVLDLMAERYEKEWGDGQISDQYASRRGAEPSSRYELASTSHNQLAHLLVINRTYDIRAVLPTITAPTLVLHMADNVNIPAAHGEYIAAAIPGARLVLLPGTDQLFLRNHSTAVIDEVEQFVTGELTPFADRVHTTMLFTDIVDSTALAASMGDDKWGALIDEHNERVHLEVVRHDGQDLKSTGDGFLVAFDDTVAAVRCAMACHDAVVDLGLELRAGVHVGEAIRMGHSDLSGLAVHHAQRLCARAEGGQVLVSADVRAACEGSGLVFEDRGLATLKGIPGKWEVFEARRPASSSTEVVPGAPGGVDLPPS